MSATSLEHILACRHIANEVVLCAHGVEDLVAEDALEEYVQTPILIVQRVVPSHVALGCALPALARSPSTGAVVT